MSEVSGRSSAVVPQDPDYISYLLDPEQEYNCYFVVGNPQLNIPCERIGVVKKMLLAHSIVFRAELQDSKIAEKNDVPVPDMYPDTFRNMLRYTYGYDNTSVMTFDEADNLLYVAEKYMIVGLKNKLARRLMFLLNAENICSLMNNPACYKMLELDATITEILQSETNEVLSNHQFMNLCPDGFLKILEQETLSVNEIEIWRSAVEWAKNRTHLDGGPQLRKELSNQLQHIRVCSLSYEEICTEVIPTEILTYDELKLVCQSCKKHEKEPRLTSICNIVEERSSPLSVYLKADFTIPGGCLSVASALKVSIMKLHIQNEVLEIHSMELSRQNATSHLCSGTITFNEYNSDNCVTIPFSEQLDVDSPWIIPSKKSGMRVRLAAHKTYCMEIKFSCRLSHFMQCNANTSYSSNHLKVEYHYNSYSYGFQMLKIMYRIKGMNV